MKDLAYLAVILVCLLMLGAQHLLNWGWRYSMEHEESRLFAALFFGTLFSAVILIGVVIWGINSINKK